MATPFATKVSGPAVMLDYTPGGAVVAGDPVLQESLFGFAVSDIAANVLGAIDVAGVWRIPKGVLSTDEIPAGTILYWDAGNSVVTATADSHKLAGKAVALAAAADTTVDVLLDQ